MTEHSAPDDVASLARYLLLLAGLAAAFLSTFLLVEAAGIDLLTDPGRVLARGGLVAAAVGVGLLVADVLLPVPSSLVMLAHGALFGALPGAALSLTGAIGAALAGYGLGRWAGPPLLNRVCTAAERDRAARLVRRWGLLAVVVTRPVPLLAETVSVIAGAERIGPLRTLAASALGAAPAALLYAVTGAAGGGGPSGVVVLALVLLLAAALWAAGRTHSPAGPTPPHASQREDGP